MSTSLLPSINGILQSILAPLSVTTGKGQFAQPGEFFPNFTAPTHMGAIDFWSWAEGSWIYLEQLHNTPSLCVEELMSYAFASSQMEQRNIKVLGFNAMPVRELVELAEDVSMITGAKLDVTLVSDETFELSRGLGLVGHDDSSSGSLYRNFLIRPDLRVHSSQVSTSRITENAYEMIQLIDRLRAEEGAQPTTSWLTQGRSEQLLA